MCFQQHVKKRKTISPRKDSLYPTVGSCQVMINGSTTRTRLCFLHPFYTHFAIRLHHANNRIFLLTSECEGCYRLKKWGIEVEWKLCSSSPLSVEVVARRIDRFGDLPSKGGRWSGGIRQTLRTKSIPLKTTGFLRGTVRPLEVRLPSSREMLLHRRSCDLVWRHI